jgi:S-formylglutathione hydrolase FrmB
MNLRIWARAAFLSALAYACCLPAPAVAVSPHIVIDTSGTAANAPLRGRMLIFIAAAKGKTIPKKLEPGFVASDVELIGFDVDSAAGSSITVPTDAAAFPKALASLKDGTYDMQAVLDRRRMYTYNGLGDGDPYSIVERVRIAAGKPVHIALSKRVTDPDPVSTASVKVFAVRSEALSAFYHRPFVLHAGVLLPPGYDSRNRYPIVYSMSGFGGTWRGAFRMQKLQPMMERDGLHAIIVVTDSSGPTGIAEWADSATNGPWGRALTHDLIPAVEKAYPAYGDAAHRFLWGHSSGGWATLWTQVTYPGTFGGCWSSSPDPVDFHDFTGPNLVDAQLDNAFTDKYGHPWQLVRMGDKNVFTLKDFVQSSDVLGYRSSQFGSFDAVFSQAGPDGKPMPLFDRKTGAIDPAVAAYWEEHYDIASKIEREWRNLGAGLTNKIHIAVGTLDTFHLERGVLRLDARMRRLGVTPDITYFPGASHFSLFQPDTGFEGFHWAFRGIAKAAKNAGT